MHFLCGLAGNPERCAPSIHIAGSKGKGSVTAMITAILTAAGYRTARYMSPHVTDIRERICIGDSYFSEEIYCAAGDELRETAEVRLPDGSEPTYWELLTLFFFLCARRGNCDIMVVETGMGGRLDSTNVLDPLASVITVIELEHTSFLGDTIAKIAAEKAGIIKHGRPLILARQNEEALGVFVKTANEKKSPLLYLPEVVEISNLKITSQGTEFSLLFRGTCYLLPATCSLSIPGKIYAENAALAIAAVKTAFPQGCHASQGCEDAIRNGLKNCRLPARFENISGSAVSAGAEADAASGTEGQAFSAAAASALPAFIIDGAHTPESLEQCVETFCSLYGEGGVLLFGCAADKDPAAMARIVCARFSKIFITTPGTFKASDPQAVYETFAAGVRHQAVTGVTLVTDTQEAVRQAISFAREKALPLLGTGSFYLAAEIRKIVCGFKYLQ